MLWLAVLSDDEPGPSNDLAHVDHEFVHDGMRTPPTPPSQDGDVGTENWKDSDGSELAPDRFWNSSMESMIAADKAGPCLGIELNIWERAKVDILFNDIF